MKAIQYTAFGTRPKLVEVDKPTPGPGLTSAPYNMTVSTSLWGRRKELLELVEMASHRR